jgi:hypothetical protein
MLMVASAREWELGNDTDCIELIPEWGVGSDLTTFEQTQRVISGAYGEQSNI